MAIGTSDGQTFDTEWEHAASQYVDPTGRPRLTVTPKSDIEDHLDPLLPETRYDDTPTPQQNARDGSIYNNLKQQEGTMEENLQNYKPEDEPLSPTPLNVSHYPIATLDLSSIPRNDPKGPIEPGNIDLNTRPIVKNPEGGYSTVDSMSFNTNKGEVLVPKVAHDGSGILSDEEAKKQYFDTGKHLGIFDTPDNATAYAKQLHLDQEKQYGPQIQHMMQTDQAIQKLTDNFDSYKTLGKVLGRIGTGLANTIALPGKVMKGDIDIQSPEGREQTAKWAAEMALTMVMTPAPLVTKSIDGTLGSIAGIRAKTADKDLLDLAVTLDKKGFTNNEIWQNSGWYKGSDGNWRHEIPNSDQAKFVESSIKDSNNTLGKIFDYPELYKAYPDLKNMKVTFDKVEGELGHYSSDNGSINLNLEAIKRNNSVPEDTIIHEVQHAIQAKEKYVYGTSSHNIGEFIGEEVQKALKSRDIPRVNELYAIADKYLKPNSDVLQDIKKALYERSPGEREANLVELRRLMTQAEREQWSPSYLRRKMDEANQTSEYRSKVFPEETLWPANQPSKVTEFRRAANDNKIMTGDTYTKNLDEWKRIAEEEGHTTTLLNRPNPFIAAREYSKIHGQAIVIGVSGNKTIFRNGLKISRESPYKD